MGICVGCLSKGRRNNPDPPRPSRFEPNSANSAPIGNSDMGLRFPYGHGDRALRCLAGQAEGFGRFSVGGLHGAVYCVTTLEGKYAVCGFKNVIAFNISICFVVFNCLVLGILWLFEMELCLSLTSEVHVLYYCCLLQAFLVRIRL